MPYSLRDDDWKMVEAWCCNSASQNDVVATIEHNDTIMHDTHKDTNHKREADDQRTLPDNATETIANRLCEIIRHRATTLAIQPNLYTIQQHADSIYPTYKFNISQRVLSRYLGTHFHLVNQMVQSTSLKYVMVKNGIN